MIDQSVFKVEKAAFFTLGCKLNFSETSTIARSMTDEGFVKVDFDEYADVYVINTCSVTQVAEKKCRAVIQKAIRQNPAAFVVVTGCFAQLKPESIAKIPGVDLVLGSNEKFDITHYLGHLEKNAHAEIHSGKINTAKEFRPSFSQGDRTRCFLKVQDGCDYYCSYCTIPMARGRSRNGSIEQTVGQAHLAAEQGAKEIILTGVNIGDFGQSTGETFFDLIKALDKVKPIERFRISSIEPNLLSDEMIAWVAQSKRFMPHFHIPLQSGSDHVLKLMKRRYDTQLFANKTATIHKMMPHAFIGVDVIVGVNGETEADFDTTHSFLGSLPISQLHVFTYSERPGTQALKIEGTVTPEERKRRSQSLHLLSDKLTTAFYRRFQHTTSQVLFEGHNDHGTMHGYTPNYLKVELAYAPLLINTIKPVALGNYQHAEQTIGAKLLP